MNIKPCTKFASNTSARQLLHVLQEVKEVVTAFVAWKIAKWRGYPGIPELRHLAEEIIDLQTTCETMLIVLGLGEKARRIARQQVIIKNSSRGYYEVSE